MIFLALGFHEILFVLSKHVDKIMFLKADSFANNPLHKLAFSLHASTQSVQMVEDRIVF